MNQISQITRGIPHTQSARSTVNLLNKVDEVKKKRRFFGVLNFIYNFLVNGTTTATKPTAKF